MKPSLDCYPCFLQQAVNAARRFTQDAEKQKQIIHKTLASIASFDASLPPPKMGANIDRIVAEVVGIEDLY